MHLTSPKEVRQARIEVALSQAEAAQIVNVSEDTWRKWETDPMFSSYEQISFQAWKTFLIETHELRSKDSRWRVRERFLK